MARPLPSTNTKVARLLREATELHRQGKLDEAERAYRKVLKLNSRDPDGLHLLGLLISQRGRSQEGVALIKQALAVRDDFPDAHANVARILSTASREADGAIHHLRRALSYRPTPAGFCELGNILRANGRENESLAAFRASMECSPRSVEGYIYYARALRRTNDFATMLGVAQAGLTLAPDHPTLQLISAEAYFGMGRLKEGWRSYRWRFKSPENPTAAKPYQVPAWTGQDLAGRSILVWTEQGPGDEIMYANMFADVIGIAGRVVIQCSPRLAPIFNRSFPRAEIVDRDLTPDELTGIDFQSSAGELGEWLRPSFEAFPKSVSYLKADEARRDALRAKYMEKKENSILVGIAWRSSVAEAAPEKSLSLLEWGPILQVPGVTFVNLQYGDCTLEIEEATKGFGVSIIQDTSIDPLQSMDAHAAQVAAMDLVVTSSNTAAHVAGSLGIPTLCLLPPSLGRGRRWYWFAEREHCPWYPSVRPIVRSTDGDWLDVICDAGLALVDRVAEHGVTVTPHLRGMAHAIGKMQRVNAAEAYYMRLAQEDGCAGEGFTGSGEARTAALDAEGAFAYFDRAISAQPSYIPAYTAKAAVLTRLNRFAEAISVHEAALAQDPRSAAIRSNLSTVLLRLGRSEEALDHLRQATQNSKHLERSVRDAIAVNYAAALNDTGRADLALVVLDEVLERSPEFVEAHYNRAQIRLASGRLREGWLEAEWRLNRPNANVRYDSFPHIKRWDGEDLAGKRILIWTEQGVGDEVFAAGMVGDAVVAAAHVTLLCTPRLVSLFRRSFPNASVDIRGTPLPPSALDPRLDFQMSMTDLGRAFRPDLASFPLRRSYLVADEGRWRALRAKYQRARPGKLLVGISWSSHGNAEMGWLKSNNLEAWEPILKTPGAAFVNLQYGDRSADLARIHKLFGVEVISDADIDPLGDLDRFAAQVRALDLVISTSNSAVHIAGGLGVPTWVLAPEGRGRHWYWFRDRDDSPWYRSLRFIRPTAGAGWESAIARCGSELAARVQLESNQT